MIDPKLQPLRVTIEFDYDAEVFEGDPTDAYEIADLEVASLERDLEGALASVIGYARNYKLTIQPD